MAADSPLTRGLAIEAELNRERTGALARIGRKLEEQLARCTQLAQHLEHLRPGPARVAAVAEYRTQRARFDELRWYMVVQREAMGLSRHDEVDVAYPRPRRID